MAKAETSMLTPHLQTVEKENWMQHEADWGPN